MDPCNNTTAHASSIPLDRLQRQAIDDLLKAETKEQALEALLRSYRLYAIDLAQVVWLGISSDPAFIAGTMSLEACQAIACAASDDLISKVLSVHDHLWKLDSPRFNLAAIKTIDAAFRASLGALVTATPLVGASA